MEWVQLVLNNAHLLLQGLWVTVQLAAVVILLGTVAGLAGGLTIVFAGRPLRWLMRLYVDLLRGLPLLVTIFVIFYGLPALGLRISRFTAAAIALSAFAAAHMAEIFRGAVSSVDRGQWLAAKAIGLRFWPSLTAVILPQALRRMIPPWINLAVEMVKGTSLVSLVSVVDLLLAAQQVLERTQQALLFYGVAAGLYLAVNLTLSRMGALLERRFAYYD